ncbi:MAG: transcriptional regulator [Pseudaminobacter sp.]
MRFSVHGLIVLLALTFGAAAPSAAAELVMLERPGCVWCARFNAEIAPAYPKTEEGKRAPLRRVDITGPWPADLEEIASEQFTPSFILVEDGKEIGRVRGYPGSEFFWYLLGDILAKLDAPTSG